MTLLPPTYWHYWLLSGGVLAMICLALGYQLRQVRYQLGQQSAHLAILQRELSHRVNTNLAITIGLLELQLGQTHEPAARWSLQQSISRTRSVALLQERLYLGGQPTDINLRQYVCSLYQSLTQQPVCPQLALQLDTDELNADLALPVGLILHELLTDATHHAAPKPPAVTISLKQQNGWLLELLDQGPGLDTHPTRWSRAGVPLPKRLIEGLSQQIGGNCVMLPGQGLHFRLHIQQ
ncbi:signal transduction histidine kinase [Fibrella aestuarina BUZ 2]|uniref:Signal transduction histidine kinase n=1 Tax=Fibrella aestuarina BUZ 2 TaxID=1166018 RepID=I0KA70_9BACT|nr:sensor histidine kinase [Fibrella aestuarina]CCH01023.1 signal transduction histidine kinase [Fibrella aestuarina BUZ 2]